MVGALRAPRDINSNDFLHEIRLLTTQNVETTTTTITTPTEVASTQNINDEHRVFGEMKIFDEQEVFDEMSEGEASENEDDEDDEEEEDPQQPHPQQSSKPGSENEDDENPPQKKQKPLSLFIPHTPDAMPEGLLGALQAITAMAATPTTAALKKSKKTNNNVWTKPKSRKGKKKGKLSTPNVTASEDTVLITPIRVPDRSDDALDMNICLSKVYKAEKVELSDDRLVAGSSKGYRMVRATRGVVEGAWYFEIKLSKLGETGHTRLGWSMEKGDLQAPVGYDGNSFGYRDIDGSKVHKAMRERYGDAGYVEGDVIGVYINLPDGALYTPKQQHYLWYKGQKYMHAADGTEELPKVVPGSEISFFKNGVCQGAAFKDLYGGRYFPAASMYTLPDQPNCVVKFNFGPNFEYYPQDLGCRPLPRPMIEVPYLAFDGRIENAVSDEKKS